MTKHMLMNFPGSTNIIDLTLTLLHGQAMFIFVDFGVSVSATKAGLNCQYKSVGRLCVNVVGLTPTLEDLSWVTSQCIANMVQHFQSKCLWK